MKKLKKLPLTRPIKEGYQKVIKEEQWRGKRIQNICKVLLMYDEDKEINEIIKETGISRRSIFNYKKKCLKDPFFMLRDSKPTNVSLLEDYINIISVDFKKTHIKTYKQAQKRIEEITGLKRSETQIRNFLTKNGFKKNKNGYYNQPTRGKMISTNIKKTCLYLKRDEVEKFIDYIMPSTTEIMVKKLKEKYPELKIFNDEYIIEHTLSISPF